VGIVEVGARILSLIAKIAADVYSHVYIERKLSSTF
jgi:hypothetical protein